MKNIFSLKELKIGAQKYKILFVKGDDIEKDCGECNPATLQIKIRKDMPVSQVEETLLHEIVHAINGGLDETTVDAISCGLYQVFKDNNIK